MSEGDFAFRTRAIRESFFRSNTGLAHAMSTSQLPRVAALAILLAPIVHAGPTAPLVGGSDACATPDMIAGAGTFAFDNNSATTGTEGQATNNCNFYGQIGIAQDVWFVWTAAQSGRIQLSTCGQTAVDTKVAVYAGTVCPPPGAAALECNDDITSSGIGNLQSALELEVVSGNTYTIQIGVYPVTGIGGTGTFSITYVGGVTCQYDDGTTDYASEIGTGGVNRASGWMYRMGEIGSATTITSVSSAWGWTNTGTQLAPGLTVGVAVWEDPNDDGDPSDAVLLEKASGIMVNPHTDMLQTLLLPNPAVAQGVFFVGAWAVHTTGFPVPRDILGCGGRTEVGWLMGNEPGNLIADNLALNTTPPFQAPNGQTYYFVMRADCQPTTLGNLYCAGDGVAPHTACPCGNSSAAADSAGCLNSLGVGGRLRSYGIASLANDQVSLVGSSMPNSSALYFQGTSQQSGGNGVAFGDGLRCAGGTVVRISTRANSAGTSSYPGVGEPNLSVKGLVTMPGTRTYQVWYRNAASFCTVSTFNLSNGLELAWAP